MPKRNKRLLISVKETRKLLGKSVENLTNSEVEAIIIDGEQLARFTIHQYLVRKAEVLK